MSDSLRTGSDSTRPSAPAWPGWCSRKCTSTGSLSTETRQIIDNAALSWIGWVFFVELGTRILFDWDIVVAVIPQTLILFTGLFVGQITSASLAARYTSGMNWRESLLVGFGMPGRVALAFVVIDIACTQDGIIATEMSYMLMFTVFWLNVAVPVTITLWKPCYTGEKHLSGTQPAPD